MPFVQRVIEPKCLSKTPLFDAKGKPKVHDEELEAVTNNTLSNALRQLASLVLVANDIFEELGLQLRDVGERSQKAKVRIVSLEKKVKAYDPKQVAVPESDICSFALLQDHYKAKHEFNTGLFHPSTRPSALKNLYESAAKTPIHVMRELDSWRRDGHRSSRFFVCTPVLGSKRRRIRNRIDMDIETRMPAAVEELRRWTSSEALGDITVNPDCPNKIAPNITCTDGNATDGTIGSDDEGIDHKLPSPEEQVQVIALKFPAQVVAVDVSLKRFNRSSIQRRSLLRGDVNARGENDPNSNTLRKQTRSRKPRSRRRNTIAGTDQKELQEALTAGESHLHVTDDEPLQSSEIIAVPRSKSSDPLRSLNKKELLLPETKKSHFYTLKQWGKNRLRMINKSLDSAKSDAESSTKTEDTDANLYETVSLKRKRGLKRPVHERKPSYSSSEKSSLNLPISTPLSSAMAVAVKLRESSIQRRLRRAGENKDEPHSSSGNWSASSESGRASIGSEITSTTQPKSTTSAATSSNSLNQHAPSSVNSRRKFSVNHSASSSVTSEGTMTPDLRDFHEDETSSVYSCDTEGYYTSFHMDSGLKTLKEEEMPPTPLHSTTAFSHSGSHNTILTAENEYELFGKGSTSTTASSAGTVCTTFRANGSSRSLTIGPTVPERKSSLNNNKAGGTDRSPESSLERDYGSDKTGTVKRSPASSKATVVAVIHKESNGDQSPDSGHNTSSSPIESTNSANGIRSGSEFEFSECSDMEGPDRIERIRVKTTINSSRIPSMCVITPPHSDDESGQENDVCKLNDTQKPLETDLDNLQFANEVTKNIPKLQLINVNLQSGYATIETYENENLEITRYVPTVRAPSPSGGSVTVKKQDEPVKPPSQPLFKSTLMPLNNVFDRLKSNLSNLTAKKETKLYVSNDDKVDDIIFDSGEYVTIADVRNNNEKQSVQKPTEYVSLNDLPCNKTDDNQNTLSGSDSLERKRRQGARVTLDAEGKVVYSSDSLRRRKGAHTTFEPGPFVKDVTVPLESPLPNHRIAKTPRPITNQDNHRPLSPQMGKLVIRAASGTSSPTKELIRIASSTVVATNVPTSPMSPKSSLRGAYVHMQEVRKPALSVPEKERVNSPINRADACINPEQDSQHLWKAMNDLHVRSTETPMYRTLPCRKPRYMIDKSTIERPITPDIMRGLPSETYRYLRPQHDVHVQNFGIPVQIPQIQAMPSSYKSQVPFNPHTGSRSPTKPFHTSTPDKYERFHPHYEEIDGYDRASQPFEDTLKISPIDPRCDSVGSPARRADLKSAINLESKLLSPKKSTMSNDELYAVIHKGKKKLNVQTDDNTPVPPNTPPTTSPKRAFKSPETGYLGDNKGRSRFSWSPSDGEYVDYNTNIDRIAPSGEAGTRQSWISRCGTSERKGNQPSTSRTDFKKLLLQHITRSNLSPNSKKLSAVEQLRLSKQQQPKPVKSNEVNILELSGSPRTLQNRKLHPLSPTSSRNAPEKQRNVPKLLSPKSQWRFASPRTDVLSSTIPEDCGEEDANNSAERRRILNLERKLNFFGLNEAEGERDREDGDQCVSGVAANKKYSSPASIYGNRSEEGNANLRLPTLETAF